MPSSLTVLARYAVVPALVLATAACGGDREIAIPRESPAPSASRDVGAILRAIDSSKMSPDCKRLAHLLTEASTTFAARQPARLTAFADQVTAESEQIRDAKVQALAQVVADRSRRLAERIAKPTATQEPGSTSLSGVVAGFAQSCPSQPR